MKKFLVAVLLTLHVVPTHCVDPVTAVVVVGGGLAIADYSIRAGKWAWNWARGNKEQHPAEKALEVSEKENAKLKQDISVKQQEIANLQQSEANHLTLKKLLIEEKEAVQEELDMTRKLDQETLRRWYEQCVRKNGKNNCPTISDLIDKN